MVPSSTPCSKTRNYFPLINKLPWVIIKICLNYLSFNWLDYIQERWRQDRNQNRKNMNCRKENRKRQNQRLIEWLGYTFEFSTLTSSTTPWTPTWIPQHQVICISGDTIDWIITVSNLICDPSGMATFTHIRRAHRLTGTIRREMLIGDKSPLVTPSYQESMNLCLIITAWHFLKQLWNLWTPNSFGDFSWRYSQCKYFSPKARPTRC